MPTYRHQVISMVRCSAKELHSRRCARRCASPCARCNKPKKPINAHDGSQVLALTFNNWLNLWPACQVFT